jgi:tetratricopeptide (TPR) repeat protein
MIQSAPYTVSRLVVTLAIAGLLMSRAASADDRALCLARVDARSMEACGRTIAAKQLAGKDMATIYVVRATIYRTNGDYTHAIEDLTHAIELLKNAASNEVVASAYVTRGSVYVLSGDLTKALSDYKEALSRDASNTQAAEGAKHIEAELAASKVAPGNSELHKEKERPSELSCCLAYYRGERSLEGWGPAQRCHINMQAQNTKNKFCIWLRQFYPSRYNALIH